MSTNGDNGAAGYGERLDQTEAAIVRMRAERDELDRKLSEHEERYRALMLEREKAAGVRRSRLTPKQKSEIIRARGQDFYQPAVVVSPPLRGHQVADRGGPRV